MSTSLEWFARRNCSASGATAEDDRAGGKAMSTARQRWFFGAIE